MSKIKFTASTFNNRGKKVVNVLEKLLERIGFFLLVAFAFILVILWFAIQFVLIIGPIALSEVYGYEWLLLGVVTLPASFLLWEWSEENL